MSTQVSAVVVRAVDGGPRGRPAPDCQRQARFPADQLLGTTLASAAREGICEVSRTKRVRIIFTTNQ